MPILTAATAYDLACTTFMFASLVIILVLAIKFYRMRDNHPNAWRKR